MNNDLTSLIRDNDSDLNEYIDSLKIDQKPILKEAINKYLMEIYSNEKEVIKKRTEIFNDYKTMIENTQNNYNDILVKISENLSKTSKLLSEKQQLLNITTDENEIIKLNITIEDLNTHITNLKSKQTTIKKKVEKAEKWHSSPELVELKKLNEIDEPNESNEPTIEEEIMSEKNLTIKEMEYTTDPRYFAYLYIKFFNINKNNPDLVKIFKAFMNEQMNMGNIKTFLNIEITNNKYFFEKNDTLNGKIIANKEAIQNILGFYIYELNNEMPINSYYQNTKSDIMYINKKSIHKNEDFMKELPGGEKVMEKLKEDGGPIFEDLYDFGYYIDIDSFDKKPVVILSKISRNFKFVKEYFSSADLLLDNIKYVLESKESYLAYGVDVISTGANYLLSNIPYLTSTFTSYLFASETKKETTSPYSFFDTIASFIYEKPASTGTPTVENLTSELNSYNLFQVNKNYADDKDDSYNMITKFKKMIPPILVNYNTENENLKNFVNQNYIEQKFTNPDKTITTIHVLKYDLKLYELSYDTFQENDFFQAIYKTLIYKNEKLKIKKTTIPLPNLRGVSDNFDNILNEYYAINFNFFDDLKLINVEYKDYETLKKIFEKGETTIFSIIPLNIFWRSLNNINILFAKNEFKTLNYVVGNNLVKKQ